MPLRQIESERRRSRNHISSPTVASLPLAQLPSHQEQEHNRVDYRNGIDTPSQDVIGYQTTAVSHVIDRQPAPYQYSGIAFDSGVDS
jgi:hypothetical protein